MNNLVSIITPAFRATSMLHEAVQSVLEQSYENWEMLIIADDAVDYRSVLAEQGIRDKRLRFFSTSTLQSGPNVARNIGLQHVKGEWIAPLDADDVYYPKRLELLLEAAAETGLSLDNALIAGEHVDSSLALEQSLPGTIGFDDFKKSLAPLLLLFHRRHVHAGWDEDVIRGADTLFNLRALESAGGARFVREAHHEYRVHGQSMCHATGAEHLFIEAYRHTLARLKDDGLGFTTQAFRSRVIAMIEEKQKINADFDEAVKNGYVGNYQSYVKQQGLC